LPYKSDEDRRRYKKRHYEDNREEYKRKAKEWTVIYRARNRSFVRDFLEKNPCVDCGEDDPVVLDFDHVRGEKRNHVSNLVRSGSSLKTVKDEMAKCEVRCSNCHRRVTALRRKAG